MPNDINAIIFDIGNVLADWDPRVPLEGLFPQEQIEAFFADSAFDEFDFAMDGDTPLDEARDAFAARHPDHLDMLDTIVESYDKTIVGPVPGMTELVERLAACKSVQIFGLSNWWESTFHLVLEKVPSVHLLQEIVVSGFEGLTKPDPAIYQLAIDRFGVTPSHTLFVDDRAINTQAAAVLGFRTHLFTDATALNEVLEQLGLNG
ncbi:MAG: HAD family phosphatase [Propionibacteriaceae bacterium]|nr:HAD family phosphatase [Propionibacteriaceae bacterium]